jgi:tocopherol O-methyltransferase
MAAERARAEGLGRLARFEVADANRLDFEAESFDAVWVIECSEHLSDKARFLASCARVLKPGGVFALCAWLRAERDDSPEHARIVAEVCRGMLCPHLASMEDYRRWMRDCGLARIEAEDVTRRVEQTWGRCAELVGRPEVAAALRATDEHTRLFVGAFAAIRRAYREGAMAYGMFTAAKV